MFCVVQKRLAVASRKTFQCSTLSRCFSSAIDGQQITLWHSPDARSLRCVWTLEEMGVANYNLITMPFPPRYFHREYLKINVLGTIPFLKDGDATMTESCASESMDPAMHHITASRRLFLLVCRRHSYFLRFSTARLTTYGA